MNPDYDNLLHIFHYLTLTLKDMRGGGGWNPPIGQDIAFHFSQDHTMVTKFLDFIHKHPI